MSEITAAFDLFKNDNRQFQEMEMKMNCIDSLHNEEGCFFKLYIPKYLEVLNHYPVLRNIFAKKPTYKNLWEEEFLYYRK